MKNLLDKCSCELRITKQLKKKLAFTDRNFWWCVILVGLVFLFVWFGFFVLVLLFFLKLELRTSSKLVHVSSSLPSSSVLKVVEVSAYYLETSALY